MLTAEHPLGHCDQGPPIELSREGLDRIAFDAPTAGVSALHPLAALDLEQDTGCRPGKVRLHGDGAGCEAAAHPLPGPFTPARDDQLTLEGQLRIADDPLAREAVLEVRPLHRSLIGIQGDNRCCSCVRLPEQQAAATASEGARLSADSRPCSRSSMHSTMLQAARI